MALDLSTIDVIVGIVVGLTAAIPVIVGWVVVPIRRRWTSTKTAFDEKLKETQRAHKEKIASLTEDHARDIVYLERRVRDLDSDLKDTKDRLERCEARWRNPPGFQV